MGWSAGQGETMAGLRDCSPKSHFQSRRLSPIRVRDADCQMLKRDYRRPVDRVAFQGAERFVSVIKRKRSHLGSKADFSGNVEEVPSVSTGHIRDAADLTLAP